MNAGSLIARLTRDATHDKFSWGSVTKFGLAWNKHFRDSEGNLKESAHFFEAVAFNGLAESLGQMKKGQKLGLTYELRQERWTDAETKQERSRVVLNVTGWTYAESKAASPAATAPGEADKTATTAAPVVTEPPRPVDLPY